MNVSDYRPVTTLTFRDASNTTSGSATAALRHITGRGADATKEALGLSKSTVLRKARLISPKRLPNGVKAGHRATLAWAGRSGVARLTTYQYNLADAWRDTYGDAILLAWETDEVT